MRADLVVTAVIVGLCVVGVHQHFGGHGDPVEAAIRPLEVGEALEADLVVRAIGGTERRVGDWFGERATVFYGWSVPCSCIEDCEPRLRALYGRWPTESGVRWIGVDGEPEDAEEAVVAKMGRVGSFYKMVLDPRQRLCRRLGLTQATQVVVLDGNGYLRYRGPLDDDLKRPTKNYLAEALEAVADAQSLGTIERAPTYGCTFRAPPDCPPEP